MIITEQLWNKHLITNAPLHFTLVEVLPKHVPYAVFTLKDGTITKSAMSSTIYFGEKTPAEIFANDTLYQYPGPSPIKE